MAGPQPTVSSKANIVFYGHQLTAVIIFAILYLSMWEDSVSRIFQSYSFSQNRTSLFIDSVWCLIKGLNQEKELPLCFQGKG